MGFFFTAELVLRGEDELSTPSSYKEEKDEKEGEDTEDSKKERIIDKLMLQATCNACKKDVKHGVQRVKR